MQITFILLVITRKQVLNQPFQLLEIPTNSVENTELYQEISCHVQLYAANFRTKDAILQNLGVGDSTWVAVLEAEHDTEPFFLEIK